MYNTGSLPIQVMTTGPLLAPSKCKSGLFNVPRVMKTKFPATVMVFGVVSSEGHIMTPHIFEVGLKVNTKVYVDVMKSVVQSGGRWQTQAWLQKECYDFVPFSHCPPPSPTWTRWITSFDYTSRTSPTWPPTTPKPAWSPPSSSIRRAPADACGKGMLSVLDPYRGWRRLHWTDVSSTT